MPREAVPNLLLYPVWNPHPKTACVSCSGSGIASVPLRPLLSMAVVCRTRNDRRSSRPRMEGRRPVWRESGDQIHQVFEFVAREVAAPPLGMKRAAGSSASCVHTELPARPRTYRTRSTVTAQVSSEVPVLGSRFRKNWKPQANTPYPGRDFLVNS